MEDIRDILRIPGREVMAVTKILAGVDLEKIDSKQCRDSDIITVMIHTRGFFLANIRCEMNHDMYRQILSGMYGGGMPPEEERACLERWAQGDLEARNRLVEHNLRLVAHIIKKM